MGFGKCSELDGNAHCPTPTLWRISRQRKFEWKPPQNPTKLSEDQSFFRKMIGNKEIFLWEYLGLAQLHELWPPSSIKYRIFEKMGGGGSFKTVRRKLFMGQLFYGMLLSAGLGTRDRPGPLWDRKIGLNLILSRCFLQLRWEKMCPKGDLFQYLFTLIW